ncbi:MAG TPA: class I SAM-dependent methyltransferase [Gaiellaceae bacterium]|nr:class I SAM-dependent methyltransferase [Gaiellaceae bacterium]
MAEPDTWQLEGAAAELYERYLVPAVTLPWALDLVDRVGLERGDSVLDVACGTGAVARVAAIRVADGGRVVGLDVNEGMLSVARSLSQPEGASIEWVDGSALALPFGEDEFSVVLCQLGLQFFSDRTATLREMRRVLVPGGRIGASVYSAIERNPATHALSAALDRHVGENASRTKRSEHSLADVEQLRSLFVAVGFDRVEIETVERIVRFASVDEYVRVQFAATPVAAVLIGFDPHERERLVAQVSVDVGSKLARFQTASELAFPQEVHVARATTSSSL